MQTSAALRRLLNNPLLLRLSAQHYAATGAIARSRADLYRQWVEEAWQRARQRGAAEQDKQQYLAALQALAWHMHTGGDSSATALQAALRNAGLAPNDHAAADLLHRLREQTGLLARLSEAHTDRYLFSHMTLREYLVAMRLLNAWRRDARCTRRFLKLRLHLPAWREPLALLAGLLDEADAQRLLTWIMRARSPEERHLHRDLLLAAKLAVESGYSQVMRGMLVPRLLRVLRSRRVGQSVRAAAARALRRIGDAAAVPGLLAALGDANADVRRAAAALGEIGYAAAVPGLLAALDDAEARVREAAAAALREIGYAAAVPGLLAALGDADWRVRRAAAAALGQIGAPAVPGLLAALRDADADVREAAAAALGEIGDAAAVPGLLAALGDADWNVREAAAAALEQIGDAAVPGLLAALGDADADVRRAAAAALGQIGDAAAVPGLLAALGDADADVRRAAAAALGEIGDAAAVPGLLAALGDASWYVRWAAAAALGEIGDAAAVPGLLAALGDADANVREAAAAALGEIGDAAAVPGLLAALGDADANVREAAAALGEIGDAAAVPGLLAALGDADANVREAAAAALGEIGDAAAVPGLLAALGDADEDVREAAAAALGEIGDAAAVPGLLHALGDTAWWVRAVAAAALRNLLPASPPRDREERRTWQKAMAAMQRTALQRGEYDLLTAILERRAAWQAALDPWQDPLQPLPVPAWQRWVLRIGRGGLVVLLAGLVGVVTVALAGVGDAVMAAVLPVLQVQPWWVSVGLVFGLGALATLLGWLVDAVRKA
jgi:HEAT repeat protein